MSGVFDCAGRRGFQAAKKGARPLIRSLVRSRHVALAQTIRLPNPGGVRRRASAWRICSCCLLSPDLAVWQCLVELHYTGIRDPTLVEKQFLKLAQPLEVL